MLQYAKEKPKIYFISCYLLPWILTTKKTLSFYKIKSRKVQIHSIRSKYACLIGKKFWNDNCMKRVKNDIENCLKIGEIGKHTCWTFKCPRGMLKCPRKAFKPPRGAFKTSLGAFKSSTPCLNMNSDHLNGSHKLLFDSLLPT